MAREKISIQFGAPFVGDGNRMVLMYLTNRMQRLQGDKFDFIDTSQSITSIPARIWHRAMTTSAGGYNESLRNSPLSTLLGCMLALEGAVRRGKSESRIGIFTQELQLTLLAMFPQLAHHFYDHIYRTFAPLAQRTSI